MLALSVIVKPQDRINVIATDTSGVPLPFQISDNITTLKFGSNTFGRQIRLSRNHNAYNYGIGLDNNEFFISNRNQLGTAFKIAASGNVDIGTANPQSLLTVNGQITAKSIQVTLNDWSDYILKKDYRLPSLTDLEKYIRSNGHLPNVPTEKQVTTDGD